MGKAVQMFCCGDWDPKRVPQGTECLEPLLDAAPSHLPSRPQRCFTGETATLDATVQVASTGFKSHQESADEVTHTFVYNSFAAT